MAFSITWNESYPSGSDLLSGVDTYIQQDKIAVRERLESLLGIADFSSRYPMSADALKMDGTTNSYILGGSVSWGVKNNAGSSYNLQITDAGVVTIRAGLTITAGGITVTAGTTSTKQLDVNHQGRLVEYDAGNSGAALTIDFNNGNNQKITLTGACTLTLSNPVAGCWYQFRLVQDATGSRTVNWPGTVVWQSATVPTLTTTANRVDMIALFYDGSKYLGSLVGLNWAP